MISRAVLIISKFIGGPLDGKSEFECSFYGSKFKFGRAFGWHGAENLFGTYVYEVSPDPHYRWDKDAPWKDERGDIPVYCNCGH